MIRMFYPLLPFSQNAIADKFYANIFKYSFSIMGISGIIEPSYDWSGDCFEIS